MKFPSVSKLPAAFRNGARAFTATFSDWADFWYNPAGSATPTWAGKAVTASTAMQVDFVYACVKLIAEDTAGLPWQVFELLNNGLRRIAREHPVYPLIHSRPNPEQTQGEWLEMTVGHAALRGQAFSLIIRDRAGIPRQLWPIHPACVTVRRTSTNAIVYDVTMNTKSETYSPRDILHIKSLSDDGLNGLGPLQLATQKIAATMAAEEYAARFWANDGTPRGILNSPNKIGNNPEQSKVLKENIRQQWRESMTGEGRHMVPVLDQDLKWQSVGVSPEDAQALETRKANGYDIAMIFRVKPSKIGLLDRATWANIEQEYIGHATDTIRPWVYRIEQRMEMSLLLEAEQDKFFIEANLDGLIRGDIQSQYNAFMTGRNGGWLSVNDIRKKLNLDPLGPEGDIHLQPVNYVPLGTPPQPAASPKPAFDLNESVLRRLLDAPEISRTASGNGVNGHG